MKLNLHRLLLLSILILSSCAMLARGSGAAAGASVGAVVAGPGGAAIGGASGYLAADLFGPEDTAGPFVSTTPPDDIWSLLGLLLDRAYWLVILAGAAYLVALLLPPLNQWKIWGKLRQIWEEA